MTVDRKARRITRYSTTAALTAALMTAVVQLASPATASGSGVFPARIHATRINAKLANEGGALRRGSPVTSAELSQRVSLGGTVLAALADRGTLFGAVYPALSTDGGRHWHIDGPLFYRAAADAPNVTNRLVALGDDTLMAWGSGGNFTKTTTDRGATWYHADFPAGVDSAGVHNGRLTVRALGSRAESGRFPTRRYTSSDGGRIWHRGTQLGSVKY
jgi:hypothetical protein